MTAEREDETRRVSRVLSWSKCQFDIIAISSSHTVSNWLIIIRTGSPVIDYSSSRQWYLVFADTNWEKLCVNLTQSEFYWPNVYCNIEETQKKSSFYLIFAVKMGFSITCIAPSGLKLKLGPLTTKITSFCPFKLAPLLPPHYSKMTAYGISPVPPLSRGPALQRLHFCCGHWLGDRKGF